MEINIAHFNKLGNAYTLWYHNPNEDRWTPDSYHEILTFQTIEEFWIMQKHIKPHMIELGMFFLMQDGIKPVWEDPHNIHGGVLSWKVENKYASKYWTETVIHFISNNLLANYDTNTIITGVCISPKRNFNIIKIWVSKMVDYTKFIYAPTLTMAETKAIYKSHQNNIEKDQKKEHQSGSRAKFNTYRS